MLITSSSLKPISLASSVMCLGTCDLAISISLGTGVCNTKGNMRRDQFVESVS